MSGETSRVKLSDTAERTKRSDAVSKRAAAAKSSKSAISKKSKQSKRSQRPPRAVRLSQADRGMQSKATTLQRRSGVSVTINVAAPKLPPKLAAMMPARLPLIPLPKFLTPFTRQFRPLTAKLSTHPRIVVLAILTVIVTGIFVANMTGNSAGPGAGKVAAAERTAPDFKPLLPSAEQASAQQYDGKRNMVSYSTTFSGARLTVSQQGLPSRFGVDPKALTAAADSIEAKQKIDTDKGPLYVATKETKDQLAVYAGGHVLVFIHTDKELDPVSWKAFIEQLQEKS